MTITTIRRGGARAGSGRKPTGVKPCKVTLDAKTITTLKELGGGELSAGIRMAAIRVGRLQPIGNGTWKESD